jgi:hypothetical protein
VKGSQSCGYLNVVIRNLHVLDAQVEELGFIFFEAPSFKRYGRFFIYLLQYAGAFISSWNVNLF